MLLKELQKLPSSEDDCRLYYKNFREKVGIQCKKCGCSKHYWLKSKWQWQCTQCKFRTTLRSGTGMQYSHLNFKLWFQCMVLMIAMKKGISAKEMQRQLGYRRYRTVWYMMQRIRASMGREECKIFKELLIDRNSPGTESTQTRNSHTLFSVNNANVAAFNRFVLYSTNGIKYNSKGCIPKGLDQTFYLAHRKCDQAKMLGKFRLVTQSRNKYIAFKNFMKWNQIFKNSFLNQMTGIHQRINLNFLQNYLDEFTYRLNRRHHENLGFEQLLFTIALN